MILQILQVTVLDIASHKIGNPVSLLTADFNEDASTMASASREILQPKTPGARSIDDGLNLLHCCLTLLVSLLKRSTAPLTNEPTPILPPPPPSLSTMLRHEAESIKNHRLFNIEALNPFQNRSLDPSFHMSDSMRSIRCVDGLFEFAWHTRSQCVCSPMAKVDCSRAT